MLTIELTHSEIAAEIKRINANKLNYAKALSYMALDKVVDSEKVAKKVFEQGLDWAIGLTLYQAYEAIVKAGKKPLGYKVEVSRKGEVTISALGRNGWIKVLES